MNNNVISLKNKIEKILKKKRLTVREFCKEINITTAGLYGIYERNTIDTKYLDKIESVFNIPKMYFFTKNDTFFSSKEYEVKIKSSEVKEKNVKYGVKKAYDNNIEKLTKEIVLLRQNLEDKEKIIKMLEKQIELLEK